jgi:hypothetical protein
MVCTVVLGTLAVGDAELCSRRGVSSPCRARELSGLGEGSVICSQPARHSACAGGATPSPSGRAVRRVLGATSARETIRMQRAPAQSGCDRGTARGEARGPGANPRVEPAGALGAGPDAGLGLGLRACLGAGDRGLPGQPSRRAGAASLADGGGGGQRGGEGGRCRGRAQANAHGPGERVSVDAISGGPRATRREAYPDQAASSVDERGYHCPNPGGARAAVRRCAPPPSPNVCSSRASRGTGRASPALCAHMGKAPGGVAPAGDARPCAGWA